MAHVAPHPRGLRLARFLVLAAATLGLGCSQPRAPECASGRWCGTLAQVEALGQTREQVLSCPMYVGWTEGAAAAPAADLPPRGEGKIDLEATRARRMAGEAEPCCYHWFAVCPGEKPLAGGSTAPGSSVK